MRLVLGLGSFSLVDSLTGGNRFVSSPLILARLSYPTLKHPSAALPDPPPRPVAGVFYRTGPRSPMTTRLEWVNLDARRT